MLDEQEQERRRALYNTAASLWHDDFVYQAWRAKLSADDQVLVDGMFIGAITIFRRQIKAVADALQPLLDVSAQLTQTFEALAAAMPDEPLEDDEGEGRYYWVVTNPPGQIALYCAECGEHFRPAWETNGLQFTQKAARMFSVGSCDRCNKPI